MPVDFDQGGTFRLKARVSLGPSIGWIDAPEAIIRVTGVGTTTIFLGTSVVTVNVNAAVTIQLPAFKGSAAGAIALPGQFADTNVTVVDIGGFATANPITILPATGETISGQASYQITSNYGAIVLQPDPINGGCSVSS